MLRNKKVLSVFAVSAALGAGSLIFSRSASADLSQCAVESGSTRFFDSGTGACGYVFENNANWADFGWNNRADQFGNDGNFDNNCLYSGTHCSGSHVLLRIGFAVDWSNTVSSNFWVGGSSCPTSC
jgi:hypothetical protein